MRRSLILCCFVTAAHSAAEIASSQVVVIRGEPTCSTCSVERQLIVRIGERDDPIKGPVVTPVARDSRGRFFVNDQDDWPIKVFTADGRFATLIGREGTGPGEFKRAATIAVGVGDSLFVTDRTLMRASVFGPDLKFARSFDLRLVQIDTHSEVVNGLLVVNGIYAIPPGIGFPLHVFDAAGQRVKRVGPEERLKDESESELTGRVIGRSADGNRGLLVAHRLRYQWWKLSNELDPVVEFAREAFWFRRYDPPNATPMHMDGVSYLKAIWEDGDGLIWVALGTIHIVLRQDGSGTERNESSRVEVLDPGARSVIASVEFPQRFVSAFSDGTVIFSEVRDDERTVLSVNRLTLRR